MEPTTMWDSVTSQWVVLTPSSRQEDGSVEVTYPDGKHLRIDAWMLEEDSPDGSPDGPRPLAEMQREVKAVKAASPALVRMADRAKATRRLKRALRAAYSREELGEIFDALPTERDTPPATRSIALALGEAWADYERPELY